MDKFFNFFSLKRIVASRLLGMEKNETTLRFRILESIKFCIQF